MTKVCIAIVSNRLIQPKMVLSLTNLLRETKYETHVVIATEGYTTAQSRIYCVMQAIRNNCTHILYLDDDMTFEPNVLEVLMETGKEIVGVNSYSRTFPLSTTVALLKDGKHWPHNEIPGFWKIPEELFECYAIGMGVALINMEVFGKIAKPWFKFDMHRDGYMIQGEDMWFCSQARKKGYSIWVEPKLKIGHIGNFTFSEEKEAEVKKFYNPHENVISI